MAQPKVFTIPASAPFVPTLIRALLDGRLVPGFGADGDPLGLAAATLYLPTRRACRLLRDGFLEVTGGDAAVLPRIVPIGDIDEDELVFAQAATTTQEMLDLAPALGGQERRLLLARLIIRWAASPELHGQDRTPLVATYPAAMLRLADDLARLMDDMTTRQVPWSRLDRLAPDHLDPYWQLTLRFLTIAREAWPAILDERGVIDAAARRDALIKAEAKRLAGEPLTPTLSPQAGRGSAGRGPVIAAGSSGSVPATAELIATIAALPNGAVVLPGLDTDLDSRSWASISGEATEPLSPAAGHPQFALQALLLRLGITRESVVCLASSAAYGREKLTSEAFRPASTSELWRERTSDAAFCAQADAACATLSAIEAANPEEEALAIAIALREALEHPNTTAALVTPDRALARRVLAQLQRWKIDADDSGGDPLAETPAGIFARLAADAVLSGLPPARLLGLLKHPITRLGARPRAHDHAVATLERAILRGPRPRPTSDGLRQALDAFRKELAKLRCGERSDLHPAEPRSRLSEGALQSAANLLVEVVAAVSPFEALRAGQHPLAELIEHHRSILKSLSDDGTGSHAAFEGSDGTALAAAFDEIRSAAAAEGFRISLGDYPDLFDAALSGYVVRRPERPGVRIRILGLLEARLTFADRLILGGLNEGTWPPDARSDAWLSRPMRQALGLDPPERRISLSAHDFAQMLGAPEVILSRAANVAGAPTVASRFIQRLAAVAGARWEAVRQRGERYRSWARTLDKSKFQRLRRPSPKPPQAARPLSLSVTDIEHWLRDPYTIYAKYILNLRELDPVDLLPGAADRGIMIHGALSEFTTTFAEALPEDAEAALIEIGRKHFAPLEDFPEARAFWWPRFLRIAQWFAAWERGRRARVASLAAEVSGTIEIPLGDRTLSLRTRADRIERLDDGRYAILDYKTGQVPTEKQVRIGLSPQLTLEAAILHAGGFASMPAGSSVAELIYVALKGRLPAGASMPIKFKEGDANSHAERALAKLTQLARRFESPLQPYLPMVLSMWKNRYGTYDHLARVKEWSIGSDEDEAEGGES